ncbi:MAG: PKD domain-containing protein [Bacteroidota bacterium]
MKKLITTLFATLVSVSIFASGHVANTSSTPVTCNGMCNGTATGSVTGGIGPFAFSWTDGTTVYNGISIASLCPLSYTLTVTDSSDMSTATTTFSITQPSPINIMLSPSNTVCAGSCATLSPVVSGGVPPYAYSWSPTNATQANPVVCPNFTTSYTLTVVDGYGCTSTASTTVNVMPLPAVSLNSPTVSCSGTSTTLAASGASTYMWSAGATPTGGNTASVTPSATTSYTVTGTTLGCTSSAVATVTVTNIAPSADFTYAGSPYCQTGANPYPTFFGGGIAGTFTSSPAVVVFVNSSTGEIDVANTVPGTITITNTVPATGGCPSVTATSYVIISQQQSASFSYPSNPYCQSIMTASPTFTNGGLGGSFTSSSSSLDIDPVSGDVIPFVSAPGTYTITNTIPALGGCSAVSDTASVIILPQQSASFSYTGNPYCQSATNPFPTFPIGVAAGTFTSSPMGLTFVNTTTGEINLLLSAVGTYTITNTVPATGSCPSAMDTATIIITPQPVASFSYPSNPYCQYTTNPSPSFVAGGVAGNFSSTFGLNVDPSTGIINLSASPPGTYTVTNTVAASGGCTGLTSTASVTITANTYSTFSYSANTFCESSSLNPIPTIVGNAGTFSATPPGLVIGYTSGQIIPSTSVQGTYVVHETIPPSGGCPSYDVTANVSIVSSEDINLGPDVTLPCSVTTLTISTPPAPDAMYYTWYANAGATITSGQGTPAITVSLTSSPTQVYVHVGANPVFGFCGNLNDTVHSDTVNISFGGPIAASFTMVPDSTNGNNYFAFNSTTGNGLSYYWDFNDGQFATVPSPSHVYSIPATYHVCLAATSGTCVDTVCHDLTYTGAAAASCLSLFDASRTAFNSNNFIITNLSYGSNLSYLWDFGDGSSTSSLALPTHTYASTGPYQLCLTVDNGAGCNQTFCDSLFAVDSLGHSAMLPISIVVVDGPSSGTSVGINETTNVNGITSIEVAPNPFNETTVFTIHSSTANQVYTFEMMDVLGKHVREIKDIHEHQFTISRNGIKDGLYFYKVMNNEGVIGIGKVIIK